MSQEGEGTFLIYLVCGWRNLCSIRFKDLLTSSHSSNVILQITHFPPLHGSLLNHLAAVVTQAGQTCPPLFTIITWSVMGFVVAEQRQDRFFLSAHGKWQEHSSKINRYFLGLLKIFLAEIKKKKGRRRMQSPHLILVNCNRLVFVILFRFLLLVCSCSVQFQWKYTNWIVKNLFSF